MKNIFLSIVVICALAVAGVGGVLADWTESDSGDYCFTAGYLNLVLDVNGSAIDQDDIGSIICAEGFEPGWHMEKTLSFHVYGDDTVTGANLSVNSTFLNDEMTRYEPELTAGDTTTVGGELQNFLKVTIWDDTDADHVKDVGETVIYDDVSLSTVMAGLPFQMQLTKCVDYFFGISVRLPSYAEAPSVNQCMSDKVWGTVTFTVTAIHGAS